MAKIGYTSTFITDDQPLPSLHPGRASTVIVNDIAVGYVAELHPQVVATMEVPVHSAVAVLNLQQLLQQEPSDIVAKKLAAYPAITYDETIERNHSQQTAELLTQLQNKSDLLESVEVVDTYQPQQSTNYNLTLRFTYRSPAKTLTEQEVKPEHEKVMSTIN